MQNRPAVKDRINHIRETLKQTMEQILSINSRRKRLSRQQDQQLQAQLNEELRVLNKIVEQQATMLRHYEKAYREAS